jgi:hypothetical protein
MCFREFKLKFIFTFLLYLFSMHLFADCNPVDKEKLSKLLNGSGLISIGNEHDANAACTFVISSPSGSGKLHTSYIYQGEDRFSKMLRHGLETYYSSYQVNSRIKNYERHYVYGKIDGLETTFYPNGKIASEAMYKNDLQNGIKTVWNEDGVKISEKFYRDGVVIKSSEAKINDKTQALNPEIEIAKQKCIKLGFKEKTEKFGVCVLEFIN